MPRKKAKKVPSKICDFTGNSGCWYHLLLDDYIDYQNCKEENKMADLKKFKIHNWNAELDGENNVQISFDIAGIGKPEIFVTIFQAGKGLIERIQSGGTGSYWDIFLPLITLVSVIQEGLKKSK